jgi:exo-beta-1,3-glucanase (GH17 family)
MKLTHTTPLTVASLRAVIQTVLAMALVTLITACGGGGQTPVTDVRATPSGLRALPASFNTRKAVAYSPYRTATTVGDANKPTDTSNEVIPDANIEQDLRLLVASGIGLIRLFDSTEKVASATLRVIKTKSLPLKVQLGVYVQSGNESFSQDQIARAVALANIYSDIVDAVSVGNESMVYWSTNPIGTKTMVGYLNYVRSQISQPITTDDNFAFFANAPREILDAVDFVSMHSYVMLDTYYDPKKWDWRQADVPEATRAAAMMNAALDATKQDYDYVRNYLDSKGYANLPVTIGETGWKAVDSSGADWYKFRASPVNQKIYYDRLQAWATGSRNGPGPKAIFWFEAFDEQWKSADDKWGLFNKDRQARCAVAGLNPASATWAIEPANCAESAAVYYKAPILQAKVETPTYVLNSEAVNGWPTGLRTDAFSGTTVTYNFVKGDSDPADSAATLAASNYILLSSYQPTADNYGWGMLYQSAKTPVESANLSNFANGSLNFSIKTGYVGKLRIGISSETDLGTVVEANVMISKDKYGYCNDATKWCAVSIPLKDFVAANPQLDLRYVLTRFAIADIWSETGNAARSGMPSIALDNIYWKQ